MGGSPDNRHSIITKADFEPMAQSGELKCAVIYLISQEYVFTE